MSQPATLSKRQCYYNQQKNNLHIFHTFSPFTISPSLIIIFFCAVFAIFRSCVIIINLVPFLLISFNIFIIASPVLLSRLPVGSSANIIEGLLANDLAIETLCLSPPL